MFARRKAADRVQKIVACQLYRFSSSLSYYQLRQNRTTNECWRTAVREIASSFDPFAANDERQPQPIAANRIVLLDDDICFRQLTGVTRVCEMIFECGGVRHDLRNSERPIQR